MMPVQGFVQRLNQQLLLNGNRFRIAGANNYYLAYVAEDVQKAVLDLADALSLNALRVWAFLDAAAPGPNDVYFQSWNAASQSPQIHDGPNGLERLDRAIAMAGDRGYRLILALTNNWPDFGGMPQYVKWFGLPSKDSFYRSAPAKQAYRNWVQQLITRRNTVTGLLYRDDPAILAWELANEPRCETDNGQLLPDGVPTLLAWVEEMSQFIRSLDANHLIAVGDEGYFRHAFAGNNALFNGRYGVSCEELLGIGLIDFGTVHLYPHQMGGKQDPVTFGKMWIAEHIAAAQRANKPMLIEEYGIENTDPRNATFDAWLKDVEALGGAGDLLWMLGLPKSDKQPYAPDGFVVSDAAEVPAVRDHAIRISAAGGASSQAVRSPAK